jgi:hypothetical protein
MILDNRRVSIDELQQKLRNNDGSAHGKIEDRLGFHKVYAR